VTWLAERVPASVTSAPTTGAPPFSAVRPLIVSVAVAAPRTTSTAWSYRPGPQATAARASTTAS